MNEAGELCGLITVKDMMKSTEHPLAAKDEHGRLRVAAAIGLLGKPRAYGSYGLWPAVFRKEYAR